MDKRALPNRQLVVYGLYLLGGESKPVHTEDITLKCFELFPTSFSWVKHPHLPDKDIVRVALTDARKAPHGAMVEGRAGERRGLAAKTRRLPVEDGWMLTPMGASWIRELGRPGENGGRWRCQGPSAAAFEATKPNS